MEQQRTFIKNLTSTVCVVGMAFSAMSYNNTQVLMNVQYDLSKKSSIYSDYKIDIYSTNAVQQRNHAFLVKEKNGLMEEAESLFGKMRTASDKELESVNNYIKSISIKTGVDFFTLC